MALRKPAWQEVEPLILASEQRRQLGQQGRHQQASRALHDGAWPEMGAWERQRRAYRHERALLEAGHQYYGFFNMNVVNSVPDPRMVAYLDVLRERALAVKRSPRSSTTSGA